MRSGSKAKPFTTEDAEEQGETMRPQLIGINSADFFVPGFEILFHHGHELVGDGTVD